MDQIGEIWAGLLEDLSNNRFEDALNEFMRLSNTVSRMVEESDKKVAVELEREGEMRLTKALAAEIQRVSKQSIARARNGDLSTAGRDVDECLRLLRVRIGVDLISRNASAQSTTAECRQPIKQMMVVHLTVICTQKRDELRARLDLKKKAKNIVTSAEDGFLDAIEACAAYVAAQCKVCYDSEMPLSSSPTQALQGTETSSKEDDFFAGLIRSLHEVGASQVKVMMQWFHEDRRIKTYWFKRADDLGGLTLPRALHHHQEKAPTPTPSPPPSQGPSRGGTPAAVTVKPLDESESSSLDLLLHESSQILSLCQEFQKGILDDIALEFVSAMVKLDELWLTHNVTKAVAHAVSIEIEAPIWVNSVAEDTFHVVGTCFARAVNSHSLFASEATANHVAGFISDGFFEILKELIRKDAPSTANTVSKGESKATRAVAQIETSRTFVSTSIITPLYIEAINTLASARSYCEALKEEMTVAFQQSFHHMHAMAPLILDEAMKSMDALLEDSIQVLVRSLVSAKALRVLNDALDPRALPYELNVVAFERENIVKASWVKDYVDAQFRTNLVIKECIPTLSHGPASQVVQGLVRFVCDQFEEKLKRLRFTALGALQFDKDVRSLCETIVTECNSLSATATAALMESSDGGSAEAAASMMQKLALDDGRRFDAEVRSQFKRLRHWAFLLNLERASDQKEIAFPAKALSDEEIQAVLKRRTERDFFA